ncbi:Hypothetical_protein [Hexamita inflata]|uniref:Hypothetical_protein n=1 Tax=Hexamita inflata TaxID=28002 RepID=A0ABP1LME0_9EUKA
MSIQFCKNFLEGAKQNTNLKTIATTSQQKQDQQFFMSIQPADITVMIAQDDSRVLARILNGMKLSTISSEIDESPEDAIARTLVMVLQCITRGKTLKVNFTPIAYQSFFTIIEDISNGRRQTQIYKDLLQQLQETSSNIPSSLQQRISQTKEIATNQDAILALSNKSNNKLIVSSSDNSSYQSSSDDTINEESKIRKNLQTLIEKDYRHVTTNYVRTADYWKSIIDKFNVDVSVANDFRDMLGVVDFCRVKYDYFKKYNPKNTIKFSEMLSKQLSLVVHNSKIEIESHVQLKKDDGSRCFLLQHVLKNYYFVGSLLEKNANAKQSSSQVFIKEASLSRNFDKKQSDQECYADIEKVFAKYFVKHDFSIDSVDEYKVMMSCVMDQANESIDSIESMRSICGLVDITSVRKAYSDDCQPQRRVNADVYQAAIQRYIEKNHFTETDRICFRDLKTKQLIYTRSVILQLMAKDVYNKLSHSLIKKALGKNADESAVDLQISNIFKSKFEKITPEQLEQIKSSIPQDTSKENLKSALRLVDFDTVVDYVQHFYGLDEDIDMKTLFTDFVAERNIVCVPELTVEWNGEKVVFTNVCSEYITSAPLPESAPAKESQPIASDENTVLPIDAFEQFFNNTFENIPHDYNRIQYCWDKLLKIMDISFPANAAQLRESLGVVDYQQVHAMFKNYLSQTNEQISQVSFFKMLNQFIHNKRITVVGGLVYGDLNMVNVLPHYFVKGKIPKSAINELKPSRFNK